MKEFLEGRIGKNQVMVDPNDIVVNPAGTNMTVACYLNGNLDRGIRKPEYYLFRQITLPPKERDVLESIFKAEKAALERKKKNSVAKR